MNTCYHWQTNVTLIAPRRVASTSSRIDIHQSLFYSTRGGGISPPLPSVPLSFVPPMKLRPRCGWKPLKFSWFGSLCYAQQLIHTNRFNCLAMRMLFLHIAGLLVQHDEHAEKHYIIARASKNPLPRLKIF